MDNRSQKKKGIKLGWDIWLEKEGRDLKDFSFHGSTALGCLGLFCEVSR